MKIWESFRYARKPDEYYFRVISNNRFVASWMFIPLIASGFMFAVQRDLVWGVVALMCLVFVESLRNGWTQAIIILENRGR